MMPPITFVISRDVKYIQIIISFYIFLDFTSRTTDQTYKNYINKSKDRSADQKFAIIQTGNYFCQLKIQI